MYHYKLQFGTWWIGVASGRATLTRRSVGLVSLVRIRLIGEDDPYALASAAYVEDYNFDVPEGMDLMVHRHSRDPDSLDVLQDCQTDVAPVYQTVSYATRDKLDTIDNDSLTEAADAVDLNMDNFYQRVVSSDDQDLFDSDDGSVTDLDRDMSEEEYYLDSDDGSVADLDGNMSDEEDCCDSDDKDMLEDEDFVDSDVWSVTDLDSYMSDVDEEDSCDSDMGSMADLERDTYGGRLCLLCPDSMDDLQDLQGGSVDSQRMDHWRTVSWDLGIADSRTLSVCYDCLCLMALFRTVMFLARYWAVEIVWTGPDEGYCRSMAWKDRYLPRLYPPCVVDWLHGYMTEIKVPGFVLMFHGDRNNGVLVCAVLRLGVFSAGRISLTLTGCSACVGGLVDCSDWPCSDCAVDFSPEEVGIGYIRPGLWNDLLIDATPVTGSLVYSALFDCLIVYCTAGFASDWTFCSTDFVLLARFEFYIRRVSDCRKMATDGAALAEVRAGITFGVKLYIPWDAPEAVVDISSKGVVPLRNVPDVIRLVGHREGAAESRVLQGRDIRSVRVLVPDCHGVDQNVHDVTIVDMGEVPESSVSIPELSTLSQQWPPAVISHMGWRQQELEERAAAEQRFRQIRPSSCVYCGGWIKCDSMWHDFI